MAKQKQQCFDDYQFNRFLEKQTDETEEARIVAHIATCQQCQNALEELAGQPEVWREIKHHLEENQIDLSGDDSEDLRDQQRDLQKVQNMLAPTDNPEMLGRLGGYEVCGVIGRGSAGIVVKALDPRLNRFVAIKMLAPVYSNNGCARRRFEREGRAIASVKDPHVVPIHSVNEFQETPYIVMQYMPNGSLHQRIQKHGPLDTKEVVCIAMQIAKGLAAAHARGIVHRDVKPANVLLDNGIEGAMVTDFGLARVVDEATMTRSGSISGTPQYMSPEQAKGERVDPRSDLFSLGSVMYAACTGHAPFKSESVFGVIKKVCESETEPIRDSNPDIAPWLVGLISRLHAKNPDERFESADEVANLLSEELAHLQAPTMVAKPTRDWWKKDTPARAGFLGSRVAMIGVAAATILVATIAWGVMVGNGSNNSNFNPNDPNGMMVTTSQPQPTPGMLLATMKQENEKLPRFKNSVEATIDVQKGGQLFLRTNLGTLDVSTHDKPTVELKLVHTVAAKDKETASKLFKALKMDYGFDSEAARNADLTKGEDAAIVVKFPTRKLTEQEIEESDDLDELKEQLLIRNNSHFKNAEFELRVPNDFNLNLHTSAGRIRSMDIDGSAKLLAEGGHIEIGNVNGKLLAQTNGGHIRADDVMGAVDAKANGGHIEIGHSGGEVNAISIGGGIKIWKADDQVRAEAQAGTINVNFVGPSSGDSKLVSSAGSINVGYAEGLGFDIDATSGTGKVNAPFSKKNTRALQYQLNEGKYKLTATSTGSVNFHVIDDEEFQRLESDLHESRGQRAFQYAYDIHMDGRIDEAIVAHQRAAEFEDYKGIATYNLGCAWALKGDADKAFVALNDAFDFGFDDIAQYAEDEDLDSLREDDRFAELMSRMKKPAKVKELLKKANQKFGKEDFESAEKLYKAILKLEPENELAVLHLGVSIHAQDRLEESYVLYERSAKSKEFAGLGNYNLACIHAIRNEPDKAFELLQAAIDEGFEDYRHMKVDADLENIRDDERFAELMKRVKEVCCDDCDSCDDCDPCEECDDCEEAEEETEEESDRDDT